LPIYRARIVVDAVYEAKKPLSAPLLQRLGQRTQTYIRVAAFEGLEDRAKLLLEDQYKHVRVHHHDARYDRCRPDVEASADQLGPIE